LISAVWLKDELGLESLHGFNVAKDFDFPFLA
jgi:hypothetical protein